MSSLCGGFSEALAQARRDQKPVMALRLDSAGELDDVVVEAVDVHAEMMSHDGCWMGCTFANGERVTFYFRARCRPTRLEFTVGEKPDDWIDYDDLHYDHADGHA